LVEAKTQEKKTNEKIPSTPFVTPFKRTRGKNERPLLPLKSSHMGTRKERKDTRSEGVARRVKVVGTREGGRGKSEWAA